MPFKQIFSQNSVQTKININIERFPLTTGKTNVSPKRINKFDALLFSLGHSPSRLYTKYK